MRILSFDVESCTGSTTDGSLCSFGYILNDGGREIERGDILCNPLPRAFTLGGYGKEPTIKLAYPVSVFRSQPRFSARFCEIKGLFESCDLAIGFSLGNDLRYINNACDKFNLPRISFKFLDVQLLAGLVISELHDKGLKAFADKFGVEFIEHRSDEDARVTLKVMEKTVELSGKSLDELIAEFGIVLGENGKYGYTQCYSRAVLKERLSAMGKSTRRAIADYLAEAVPRRTPKRGNKLAGKLVMAAAPLFYDHEICRAVFSTAAAEGATLTTEAVGCDYYVTRQGDKFVPRLKRLSRKTRVISFEEFIENFGPAVDCGIDFFDALEAHYSSPVGAKVP